MDHDYPLTSELLERPITTWRTGEKSLRAPAALSVYAAHLGKENPIQLKKALTGLDALVNTLDDIVDTRDLDKHGKVELTANTAFASTLALTSLPEHAPKIAETLNQYFTTLFQIPSVEKTTTKRLRQATEKDEEIEAAHIQYAYRSRGMDAFAQIPGTIHGLNGETVQRITQDLRSLRARQLVFKDLKDTERDLKDGDTNPATTLIRKHRGPEIVTNTLKEVHSLFNYTEEGREEYGDVLKEAEEGHHRDIHKAVEASIKLLRKTV